MSDYPVLSNVPRNTQYVYDHASGVYRPILTTDTSNTKINDSDGNQITPMNPLYVALRGPNITAFGELNTTESRPQVQAYLNSMDDDRVWNKFSGEAGGTFHQGSGFGAMSIDGTFLTYSTLQTKDQVSYQSGRSITVRATAQFNNPVANSLQLVGPYHAEDGFGFGYNGNDFGIFHRYGRKLHIVKLSLSTPSTSAGTATITLNGQPNTVTLHATNGIQGDARSISTGNLDYFERGFLKVNWNAHAIDNDVYFTRETHGPVTGDFSYSGPLGSTGSFSIFSSGLNGTTDWYYQTGWNIDKMDGSGISKMNLNPQAMNIYEVKYGWLGALPPLFSIANSGCQEIVPVNVIPWTNLKSGVTASDPRFPMSYAVASAGSTTPMSLKGASCLASLNGVKANLGPRWSETAEKTADTTESAILAVENSRIDLSKGQFNRRRLFVESIRFSNESTTKSVVARIYIGDKTSLNGYVMTNANTNSNVLVDVSGSTPILNGKTKLIDVIPVGPTQSEQLIFEDSLVLQPKDILIATIQTNGSTAVTRCAFNGKEDL